MWAILSLVLIFSQLTGGFAHCFFEQGAEVGRVADAAFLGHLPDWKVGGEEHFFGLCDAETEDQLGGGASGDGLDFTFKVSARSACPVPAVLR